jgi:hypothetical protein
MGMRDGFTIGNLAARCGVSRDTLRFYERERLLPPARRTASATASTESPTPRASASYGGHRRPG